MKHFSIYLSSILLFLLSCKEEPKTRYLTKTMEVTATAYNSLPWQTLGDPNQTAFGDTLKPGMKVIAVSRDLLDSGLTHQSKVKIEGLPGLYSVSDKMHRRWKRRIDIYMGKDRDSARAWGRRKVDITWITDTIVE